MIDDFITKKLDTRMAATAHYVDKYRKLRQSVDGTLGRRGLWS